MKSPSDQARGGIIQNRIARVFLWTKTILLSCVDRQWEQREYYIKGFVTFVVLIKLAIIQRAVKTGTRNHSAKTNRFVIPAMVGS